MTTDAQGAFWWCLAALFWVVVLLIFFRAWLRWYVRRWTERRTPYYVQQRAIPWFVKLYFRLFWAP